MARTYAYALIGAVIATFTVTPVLASVLLPAHGKEEIETFHGARHPPRSTCGCCRWRCATPAAPPIIAVGFLGWSGMPRHAGSAPNSCPSWKRATSGSAP